MEKNRAFSRLSLDDALAQVQNLVNTKSGFHFSSVVYQKHPDDRIIVNFKFQEFSFQACRTSYTESRRTQRTGGSGKRDVSLDWVITADLKDISTASSYRHLVKSDAQDSSFEGDSNCFMVVARVANGKKLVKSNKGDSDSMELAFADQADAQETVDFLNVAIKACQGK